MPKLASSSFVLWAALVVNSLVETLRLAQSYYQSFSLPMRLLQPFAIPPRYTITTYNNHILKPLHSRIRSSHDWPPV